MAQTPSAAPSGATPNASGRAPAARSGLETADVALMPGERMVGNAESTSRVATGETSDATASASALDGSHHVTRESPTAPAPSTNSSQAVDDAIDAIEQGDSEDATAAGLSGGDGAAMGEGLRVDRIVETVSPSSFTPPPTSADQRALPPPTTVIDTEDMRPATAPAPAPTPAPVPATPPNLAPTTRDERFTTDEDTPVSGQVQAFDADGDPLSFTRGSGPQHGKVLVNADGSWAYTPNKNHHGSDSFTILVRDGQGGMATSTVQITINPVNDPPRFNDPLNPNYDPVTGHYTVSTQAGAPVSGLAKATDVDGDTLTYSPGTPAAHGTATVDSQGHWSYTPERGYHGPDSFAITVSDGNGGTATSIVHIGVTPAIDPNNPNHDPVTGLFASSIAPNVANGSGPTPALGTQETVVHVAGEHTAQAGTEVFQWRLAEPPASSARTDTIHGFDAAARHAGGDVLDLRDLLSGSADVALPGQIEVDKLLAHLDFDTQSQPGSTVIHVSASGGFQVDAAGNSVSGGSGDQQHIVLANIDLRASLGLDAQASDHQLIAELMQRGKLLVDQT